MTKPTPIEKWIEESCPNYKLTRNDLNFVDDERAIAIYKIGAKNAAHHILEELGVLESLTAAVNYLESTGIQRVYEDHEPEFCMWRDLKQTLTKLKGEPQ